MAGGKTNSQRIENLESQAANLSERITVHDKVITILEQLLEKTSDASGMHHSKLTILEQQLLVIVDLKESIAKVNSIDKELVAFKKDIEALQKWKDELKTERNEATRRWWSFGPNIVAAIISGIVALIGIGLSIGLNYWLNNLK